MFSHLYPAIAGALLGLLISSTCFGQDASVSTNPGGEALLYGPQPEAVYLKRLPNETQINIDGRINEKQWFDVPVHDEFYVANDQPDRMVQSKYKTEVRMFYNDRGFYAAFDLEQPSDSYVQRLSPRDGGGLGRDWVSIGLDTSGDGKYGYFVTIFLGDTKRDGTIRAPRSFVSTWDGAWWGKSVRTEKGWSAEFFVPWNVMTMPPSGAERTIGLYLARQVAYVDSHLVWPKIHLNSPVFMEVFQPLVLQDVDTEQQLTFFPYVSFTQDGISDESETKYGIDYFYRPTPNFQLTGTVNPDFGTVEADEIIINLSAYETFYPEKRLFFQEDIEIFEPINNAPFSLLHTRRIGSSPIRPTLPQNARFDYRELNQPSDIRVASKLSGNYGNFRFGVLNAIEDDSRLPIYVDGQTETINLKGRDFLITRGRYERAGAVNSSIGFLTTELRHPDLKVKTFGTDGHFRSKTGKYRVEGQYARSDTPNDGDGWGYFMDLAVQASGTSRYTVTMRELNPSFNVNHVGSLWRNDQRLIASRAYFRSYDRGNFKEISSRLGVIYGKNYAGEKISSGVEATSFIILKNLNVLWFGAFYNPSRVDDRNSYGNGSFRLNGSHSYGMDFGTDQTKRFSTYQWVNIGRGDFGGDSLQTSFTLNARPYDRFNITLRTDYGSSEGFMLHRWDKNFIMFETESAQMTFTTELFVTASQLFRFDLQWNSFRANAKQPFVLDNHSRILRPVQADESLRNNDFAISRLNFQLRYRWEIAPLTDLFVVYTRGASHPDALGRSFLQVLEDTFDYPVSEFFVVKFRYRIGAENRLIDLMRKSRDEQRNRSLDNRSIPRNAMGLVPTRSLVSSFY